MSGDAIPYKKGKDRLWSNVLHRRAKPNKAMINSIFDNHMKHLILQNGTID